jgi:hypothetical protein
LRLVRPLPLARTYAVDFGAVPVIWVDYSFEPVLRLWLWRFLRDPVAVGLLG